MEVILMAGEQAHDTFNDDFEAAFIDAVDDKPIEEIAEPPATPPKDEVPPEVTPPVQEVTPPVEPTPVEAPPEPTAEQIRIAELEQQLQEVIAKQKETPPAPTPEEVKATETKNTDTDWYGKEFSEDWPDIKRAIDIAKEELRAEIRQEMSNVSATIKPVVQQSQANAFVNEIKSIHPDFDTVRDGFIDWVKKQPEAITKAYTSVIQSGTAKDVASLITVFKGTKTPEPTPQKKDNSDRLSSMEDIGSRETSTTHDVDATDFSGAFDEAVKKETIN
jgi:hypothetical protein